MSKLKDILEKFNHYTHKKQKFLFPLGVVVVALIWRLYRIHQIPQGLNQDEYNLVTYLINITKNGWRLDPKYLYIGLYSYLMAGIGYFVGFKVEILRIVQALIGATTVYLFYMFVKNWFNRQTAVLASLFLATSYLHLLISRNLDPRILAPLILVAIFYSFTLAFRSNKPILFGLSGLLLGLSFYVDVMFIFVPIIAIFGLIYINYKNKKIITGYWKGFLIASVMFLLAFAPFVYFSLPNLLSFIQKFNPGSIGLFYLNLGNNIQSLFYQSPLNSTYNVGVEPILDPFITVSFICGFLYAFFYLRRKKFLLLMAWFTFGLFIVSLKATQNTLDIVVLLPVIFTVATIMLDYVLTHWVRTFPFNKSARLLMTAIFSLFLFLSIFYNYQKYFWAFGRNDMIQSNYQYKIEYKK